MTSNREDKPEPEMQEEAPVVPQPQISPDITSEATLVESQDATFLFVVLCGGVLHRFSDPISRASDCPDSEGGDPVERGLSGQGDDCRWS